MGRKSREKRERRKQNTSSLTDHHREGSRLVPPLARLPALAPHSWLHERLPELLWAALLLDAVPREQILELFRTLGTRITDAGANAPFDVRHTGLAGALPRSKEIFIDFICKPERARRALRPLLLYPGLPGREAWTAAIVGDANSEDWPRVAQAVAAVLDHQSQESTDLRWLTLLCRMAAGKYHMPEEMAKELSLYPYLGDQRKVRPSIRAAELAMAGIEAGPAAHVSRAWPSEFWDYSLQNTPCFALPDREPSPYPPAGTSKDRVAKAREAVVAHSTRTRQTSAVDPKHDTVFGAALFALDILAELLRIGSSTTVMARVALRTLLDVRVTLAYLQHENSVDLWQSFRVYGAGQVKLAVLKLEEAKDQPFSIPIERLRALANEDVWQEFLQIDLGHWANSNLRVMSGEAGVKDEYDQIYPWASAYSHGHWGAIRESEFDICGNALHRLHRLPRSELRPPPDVIPDAIRLVDAILMTVNDAYPELAIR